jgi:O-antigen/teichoic acid export membrane protein
MLLPLVFGRDFSPAILIAVAAIPGTAFGGLAIVLDQALRAQGRPFAGLLARLVSIGTMVGAGYCGAMWRGGGGVALAFSIAQLAYFLMLIRSACRHYRGSSARAFLPGPSDLMNVLSHLRKSISGLRRNLEGKQKAQDCVHRDSI